MPLSIQAEDRYWREQAELDETPLTPPKRQPCATCPWRLAFATGATANPRFEDVPGLVARLWAGNRSEDEDGGMVDGLLAFCHRGTSGERHAMVPEGFDEYTPCTSALAIQERESIRWHEREPAASRRTRPFGSRSGWACRRGCSLLGC
jgi:hypothetical protein